MFDGKAFGEQMVSVVRAYVDQATAPLLAEIRSLRSEVDALRARAPEKGEDGKSVTLDEVRPLVESAVKAEVSAIPRAQDGADADMDALRAHLADLVAALPVPEAPKALTIDDLAPLVQERVERAVSAIPVPQDGVGLAGAVIDRDGALCITLTNGEVKTLGPVVGRDGEDGDAGAPGFGLDDFDVNLREDGRILELSFESGERKYTASLFIPTMIYRGVYREGQEYERGDTVSFGGSMWHCNGGDLEGPWNGTTAEKPGEGTKYWTLAAKRGRDGKDFAGPQPRDSGPVKI